MSEEHFAKLRRIANAADADGRPWVWEAGTGPNVATQTILREGDVVLVARTFEEPDRVPAFAEFITTFDPPTVQRLLDELEFLRAGLAPVPPTERQP